MTKKKSLEVPRVAYSIDEFCHAYGISKSFYFKMKDRGETPREMRIGHRVLISFDAAQDWVRQRENAR